MRNHSRWLLATATLALPLSRTARRRSLPCCTRLPRRSTQFRWSRRTWQLTTTSPQTSPSHLPAAKAPPTQTSTTPSTRSPPIGTSVLSAVTCRLRATQPIRTVSQPESPQTKTSVPGSWTEEPRFWWVSLSFWLYESLFKFQSIKCP